MNSSTIRSHGQSGGSNASPKESTGRFWIVQTKMLARDSRQSMLTTSEYGTLQNAFDHLNAILFGGALPQVLITLQRHARARGYFCPHRFQQRGDNGNRVHEVALNPDSFAGRTDEEVLSTLGHEMVHVWQQEFGHPGRRGYHNREWAAKMHSIGLMPSATAQPGGAVTGERVSHYILEGGLFLRACREFLTRYRLMWETANICNESGNLSGTSSEGPATQTRTKFKCPNCGLNVWAKPDAQIDCHKCSDEAGELISMRACELTASLIKVAGE